MKALEKVSNDNRSSVPDDTVSDISNLEPGALSSTMNDREAGRASPSSSNVTMIEVEPRRNPTVEEVQPGYQSSPKSYNPDDFDVRFTASN